ncbi:ADP-ribosylation factor GTPase-activating protein AGD12 [Hibiscus syriacus]|uniref:ADP-ribosylation factor GTPase-activating protein AGD12 n=1 Tax=Hibiscus syriacus TaxID=106335 RepID=A0A6A2WU37_HIBSY|nr:ADP-ribosylation factor GTPase-activating protein AGD12 [Hibiscus syriacus]
MYILTPMGDVHTYTYVSKYCDMCILRPLLYLAGVSDGTCPLCGVAEESVLHALRDCPEVTSIFALAGFPSFVSTALVSTKHAVHENRMLPNWHLVASSRAMQLAYNRANPILSMNDAIPATRDHSDCWIRPPPGFVKLNVDGACPLHNGALAVGAILRDADGVVLSGRASCFDGPRNASLAEAQAIRFGLQFATETRYTQVIVESDAANVFEQLLNNQSDMSVLRFILAEARLTLNLNPSYTIRSIRRSANVAAHMLANLASSSSSTVRFQFDYPLSHNRRLRNLLNQSDNRICADCSAPDPKWASTNIGVFICGKCCDVHKSLGTHVSKVMSVTLDEWTIEQIDAVSEVGGNSAANAIYEGHIPEVYSKPGPNASVEERNKFIKSKYEDQEFSKPSFRISSGKTSSNSSFKSIFSSKFMDSFPLIPEQVTGRHGGIYRFIEGHGVEGPNLAIRDMMTRDPYVVLTLGQQTIQTSVVPSSMNPIWNEDLMLSVPSNYGPLKLEVYDHDTFSADDIMGDASIDIHPLISAAMAYGDPEMFENMQIGKWLKTEDNGLIEDSIINIVDGKVKQYVQLKLQNVESGEIYLDVEWLPLDQ